MRLTPQASRTPLDPALALINVVFLLLLFFVVTGTIVYQHDRSIDPPTSFLLNPGKAPVDAIYIDAEGTLSFRGEPAGPAAIAQALRAGPAGEAGEAGEVEEEAEETGNEAISKTVRLVADRRLRARTLLAIVEELKDEGLQSLAIVTVRELGSREPAARGSVP